MEVVDVVSQQVLWFYNRTSVALHVTYSGPALQPSSFYRWRVSVVVTSENRKEQNSPEQQSNSVWSATHTFVTVLPVQLWQGVYVQGQQFRATRLRTRFSIACAIKVAALHISGLGYYSAWLDGQVVGDHELDPIWTRYDRRVHYVTHDISAALNNSNKNRDGGLGQQQSNSLCEHVLEVQLASGHFSPNWFNGSAVTQVLAQINAVDSFGVVHVIGATSPSSWNATADGPLLAGTIYGGEVFNASAVVLSDTWLWVTFSYLHL